MRREVCFVEKTLPRVLSAVLRGDLVGSRGWVTPCMAPEAEPGPAEKCSHVGVGSVTTHLLHSEL